MPETEEMGRVVVTATIENLADRYMVERGLLAADEARAVVVDDALVDTGATRLALPKRLIDELGLTEVSRSTVQTASGKADVGLYSAVWLTINGRYCPIDVSELPDECPVLIGQVPLELMDWVVDMRGQSLVGNPRHDGKWMMELY